jgi:hypothetical protein
VWAAHSLQQSRHLSLNPSCQPCSQLFASLLPWIYLYAWLCWRSRPHCIHSPPTPRVTSWFDDAVPTAFARKVPDGLKVHCCVLSAPVASRACAWNVVCSCALSAPVALVCVYVYVCVCVCVCVICVYGGMYIYLSVFMYLRIFCMYVCCFYVCLSF